LFYQLLNLWASFYCDAPFIVPNLDLAFARLAIEFISMIPIVIGTIGLMFINFTGDCPGAGNIEGRVDSHPALRRRAVHSVLKWAKVTILTFFP